MDDNIIHTWLYARRACSAAENNIVFVILAPPTVVNSASSGNRDPSENSNVSILLLLSRFILTIRLGVTNPESSMRLSCVSSPGTTVELNNDIELPTAILTPSR